MGGGFKQPPMPAGYRQMVPGWKSINDIIPKWWSVHYEQVYHVDEFGPFIHLTIADLRNDPIRRFTFEEPEATFPSNMLITQVMLLCG